MEIADVQINIVFVQCAKMGIWLYANTKESTLKKKIAAKIGSQRYQNEIIPKIPYKDKIILEILPELRI